MAKRKEQTMMYKTLHRKLKIEQHEIVAHYCLNFLFITESYFYVDE